MQKNSVCRAMVQELELNEGFLCGNFYGLTSQIPVGTLKTLSPFVLQLSITQPISDTKK